MIICRKCDLSNPAWDFRPKRRVCRTCEAAQKHKEYHSDIEMARLEARIKLETPKAQKRRIDKLMSRYLKHLPENKI